MRKIMAVLILFFLIIIFLRCGTEECGGPATELPTPILHNIPMERFSPDVAELDENGWFIKKNCTLASPASVPSEATAIAILASGSSCEEEWPLLDIYVDTQIAGSIRICSTEWGWYVIPIDNTIRGNELRITFSNDRYTGSEDINIAIRKVVFLGV